MSCRYIKLGEVADVKNGYAFKSKDFVDTGIPIIKIKNITPPNVTLEDVQFVSGKIFEETKRFKVEYNDILISMTGSGANQMSSAVGKIGRVRFQDTALQNQRVGKIIVKDESKYDSNFLYYFLTQTTVLEFFVFNSTGSANQANISAKLIKDLLVPDIDIKCQKDIATVLSSLDKKIENNNKIIANLETQAQAIFKSRFVDFEPFQDGEFVESELGLIPEGWEVRRIGKETDLFTGFPFKSKTYVDEGEFVVITIKNITDGSLVLDSVNYIEEKPANLPSEANLKIGDIVFTMTGNVGRVALVNQDKLLQNQRIGKLILTQEEHRAFYYFLLRNENYKSKIINLAHGTAQANLGKVDFGNILIPFNYEVIDDFSKITEAFLKQIVLLNNQNQKLAQIRDTLLPKLMSGEIRVGQDDIEEIENLL